MEKLYLIINKSYATSKSDLEIATDSPCRNDNGLDLAINDGKGQSKVISCIVLGVRAYGDHLLGVLNA